MTHNNRDHHGGGPPPTVPSPYDPQQHYPRPSYSPLRDPRDWNRLPPPGHSLNTLAGEPAFGNRFRTDNSSWRPMAPNPLPHPMNIHMIPQNVEYLHHWTRPPFLRPDLRERSDEPESLDEPGRPHRLFGSSDIIRNADQAVHQHFEESFRVAQEKGIWPVPIIKEDSAKSPRPPMPASIRTHVLVNTPGKPYSFPEDLPSKQNTHLDLSRSQAGRAQVSTTPRMSRLPNSFPQTSDNKFLYHNDRTREIISPPAMRETIRETPRESNRAPSRETIRDSNREPMRESIRDPIRENVREPPRDSERLILTSSRNHSTLGNHAQAYMSSPTHRIKVSSPAPPQIYGKPGIQTYNAPSVRNYDSLGEMAPLSLTSKVSTRPSEAPPHISAFASHQHHSKNVPHYMFNPGNTPGRSYSAAPTVPYTTVNITPVNNYQTQPLDLGGKRKSNSEPINLNVKKVRNESRTEQPQGISSRVCYAPPRFVGLPALGFETDRIGLIGFPTIQPELRGVPIAQVGSIDLSHVNDHPARKSSSKSNTINLTRHENRSEQPLVSPKEKEPFTMQVREDSSAKPIPSAVNLNTLEAAAERLSPKAMHDKYPKIEIDIRPAVIKKLPVVQGDLPQNAPSYPVHKLKKAWMERLTGEDGKATGEIPDASKVVPSPHISCLLGPKTSEPSQGISGDILSLNLTVPNLSEQNTKISTIDDKRSPDGNKLIHLKKKTAVRARNMTNFNGHDNSSSSDSEPNKIQAKRPRAKGKRKHAKEKKEKLSGSMSESAKDSDDSRDYADKTGDKIGSETASAAPNEVSPSCKGREPKLHESDQVLQLDDKRKTNPFKRLNTNLLKKTGESFVQDGSCNDVAPKLSKCRECRWSPSNASKKLANIFCRFYAFRKLRYTKNGVVAIAGFCDPKDDPTDEELSLWLPSKNKQPKLELELAKLIMAELGDQLCDMAKQESEAQKLNPFQVEKSPAWKRVVHGVREMCDVCDMTLFNFHWACGKCGFVVCINCYKSRRQGTSKSWEEPGKDRDNLQWLLCSNKQCHDDDKLMLTQSIVGDALTEMVDQVHKVRVTWKIPQFCQCDLATQYSEIKNGDDLKLDQKSTMQSKEPTVASQKAASNSDTTLPTQASVRDNKEDTQEKEIPKTSKASDEDEDGHSTLRDLLIRPSTKREKDHSESPEKLNGNSDTVKECVSETVTSSMAEGSAYSRPAVPNGEPIALLKHFIRPGCVLHIRKNPHILVTSLLETSGKYPTVPHSWLCGGKLLRLHEPSNQGNYKVFQEVWQRGQPVIVSNVSSHLNLPLWNPETLSKCCGDLGVDLINCTSGEVISNLSVKNFLEGFDNVLKRPVDDKGTPLVLKLKNWPTVEDFPEVLPLQFRDFMAALPLADYTTKNGRMNLTALLPDNFVKPDLGPYLSIAYGSGLRHDKGTTNLQIQTLDSLSLLVYISAPNDCDKLSPYEILGAIKESDCDALTISRVTRDGDRPGALWHIFNPKDADKIRDLLNKVSLERGNGVDPNHDPMLDQSWYLDAFLRKRLLEEYGVAGYPFVQCFGDAVLIPAGAPHQVRNLQNCINVAEDFISPESASTCFHLTEELRNIGSSQANHDDRLQIKSIIYHAVKDAISVLSCSQMDSNLIGVNEAIKSTDSSANNKDIIN